MMTEPDREGDEKPSEVLASDDNQRVSNQSDDNQRVSNQSDDNQRVSNQSDDNQSDGFSSDFCLVTTTADQRELLVEIANRLVDEHLAACCQIVGPHTSIYRWEGKTEVATEWMCFIKTASNRYELVEQRIRQLHSYQTPEIIATPITGGSHDYLEWMKSTLTRTTG